MRLLVTGGAGFVALHAAEIALARGHAVRLFDLRSPDPGFAGMVAGAEFRVADLLDDTALSQAVDGCEAVIHCAALVGPAAGRADPLRAVDVNVRGTALLLDRARAAGIRIVNVSTATLYGNRPDLAPLDEDEPPDPVSIYDATKLMAETLCRSYRKTFGVAAASVRTGFVYGFGSRIGQYFVPAVLAGQRVHETVGGDHPCDFTYVCDLARGLVDAVERPDLPDAVYNITGGRLLRRRDFAAAVRRALPDADIDAGSGVDPARHLRGPSLIARAARDFGYAPRFDLDAGIADWIRRARSAAR